MDEFQGCDIVGASNINRYVVALSYENIANFQSSHIAFPISDYPILASVNLYVGDVYPYSGKENCGGKWLRNGWFMFVLKAQTVY
jgi:hypothetical protein